MDVVVTVLLPISLAIIMLSLGVGLTIADFRRVAERGWAFAIGALSQVVMVPLAAWLIVTALGFSGEIAVGFMLLSFCPGGVTSNMISKYALGDVALSVSLTAVVSLLSILTVPFLAAWAVVHFMGADAPEVSVSALAFAMFLITTLPVAIGVAFRHLAPAAADRIEPGLAALASLLFVIIVIASVAGNWDILMANLPTLGPGLVGLNIALMLIGLAIAAIAGLTWRERKTIAIETGIQNAALGITLATLVAGATDVFPPMAMPSGVYGVTMYLVALPFVLWFRSK